MSRSGYTDENEDNTLGLYRANVDRASAGKRGQVFFTALLRALDAMPEKRLITDELEYQGEPDAHGRRDGDVCALGALGKAQGRAMADVETTDWDALGSLFSVAPMLAQETMYENDEGARYMYHDENGHRRDETPEERWERMRRWARANLTPATLLVLGES